MENERKESEDLLTIPEAAHEANVTEDAIRKAIRRQRLPAVEKYGRKLITRSAFNAYRKTARPGRPQKTDAEMPSGEPKSPEKPS